MKFAPPLPAMEQCRIDAESDLVAIAEIEAEQNQRQYMRHKLDREIEEIREAGC